MRRMRSVVLAAAFLGGLVASSAPVVVFAQSIGFTLIGQNNDIIVTVATGSLAREPDSEFVVFDMRYESKATFNLPKTRSGNSWSIGDMRIRADCASRRMYELDTYFRDRNGKAVEEYSRGREAGVLVPTPPGSLNALALQWACNNAPARRVAEPQGGGVPPSPSESAHTQRNQAGPTGKEREDGGGRFSGTGFAVSSRGHVLTNNHVVKECSLVDVMTAFGRSVAGRVVARDVRNDLALIETQTPTDSVAVFRRTALRSGEDIVALGFPYRGLLASDVNVSVGIVSAMAGLRNDTSQLQISAPVQPGNSGGPLLDLAGGVVGVVVAKLDALAVAKVSGDIPQNINFAIKGELAQSFLRSHGIEPRQLSESAKRTSVADVVQAARTFTYLIECDSRKAERIEAERVAAIRAEEEKREADRKAEEVRLESERRANAQRKAELERAEIAANLKFGLPIRCELGRECFVFGYFDHGSGRDYACGSLSTPGFVHTAIVLSPEAQERSDVPVVAAAAGQVTARNALGIEIDHGGGWRTRYTLEPLLESMIGRQVAQGQTLGYVSPNGAALLRQVLFTVVQDGVPVDPFRPSRSGACGLGSDTRWSAEAVKALTYAPIVVNFAGFSDEVVDFKRAQLGEHRRLPNKSSTVLSFWAWVRGVRQGDKVDAALVSPSGEALASISSIVEKDDSGGWIVRVNRTRLFGYWDAGKYVGRLTVKRGDETVFGLERALSINSSKGE